LFDQSEVAVIEGDASVAKSLTEQPFDHIFFTGSPGVGRQVMAAAATNLTSVTLELGGKSPVIIDSSADLAEAATKIVWGKCINAGQSCVAPDYVLVPKNHEARFLELARKTLEERYGPEDRLADNPDYGRIVNKDHFRRVKNLVDSAVRGGAHIEVGGTFQEEDLFIPPTFLSSVRPDSDIMQEEIFGPILPIVSYEARDEAIQLITTRPKPLALYVFAKDDAAVEAILGQVDSGDSVVNDVLVHYASPYLPFGGVHHSGMGKAHGFSGFKAFSHERAVMHQRKRGLPRLLYPPYTPLVRRLIRFTLRFF
jgi:aldehyde dehydrogenase (NAD+)